MPSGESLQHEQQALDQFGLSPQDFRKAGRHKVKGARRPLRVRPRDVDWESGVDEHGGYVTVAFSLPSGSYATVFLRELMKSPNQEITEHENSGSAEPIPEV